ncbi:MAG: methionine adenosyltransferase [Clostridia bacterium]|nr:methionine adenosyltransferase [Clostridia bacterium]
MSKRKVYKRYFLTSESVTEGHPDKVADLISDTILDECLKQDKNSRVAVETMLSGNKVFVAGEITSNAIIDIENIVRNTLEQVGYDDENTTMDYRTCEIEQCIKQQSNDIAMGIDKGGAGDQGIMFGFACDETEEFMPYPITVAHKITQRLAEVRKTGEIDYLKSDGKAQVTVEYINNCPIRIDSILISTQHLENVDISVLQMDLINKVIAHVVEADMVDLETKLFINPTGRFVIGGAIGDTGLTGRKIICDTYGGYSRHGGGAFSGKDGTKVDRSASYMARHIAKNVVANGMARRCEIQLSYGIGMQLPISIYINCFGTNTIPEHFIIRAIKQRFDLTPAGIIEYLKLQEPIYSKTTNYGHFGREGFTWEKIVQM